MTVATVNKNEEDKKISLEGFFRVAAVLGIPRYKGSATEGVEFFSYRFENKDLSVYQRAKNLRVLETNAVTLDFLWRKVGRLVHPMMINYKTFEVTFYWSGHEVLAVNVVAE